MSLSGQIDDWQQRHPVLGFPIAVVYKYIDDQAAYLAALITYYGFLSLFPLFLLLASILGFFLDGDPELQQRIYDSALGQFPVIGDQLGDPAGYTGSVTAVTIGIAASLYGSLGVGQAIQNAMNTAWAVPRHRRPNPFTSRLRGLLLLPIGFVIVLAATGVSTLAASADAFGGDVDSFFSLLLALGAVLVNTLIFLTIFRLTTARTLTITERLPGAILAAVMWQVLQTFGTAYVGGVIRGASAVNGVFAVVLGLIAWVYLASIILLFCVEINVVRAKQLYPRALLTVFTDNVDLTPADQRSYTDSVNSQRLKGFEEVEVTFRSDGQNATARRARRNGEDLEDDIRAEDGRREDQRRDDAQQGDEDLLPREDPPEGSPG